jgi:hypothetical protein
MDEPRLSVLMAARNAERYLGLALDDLLGQTFGAFELVVVDDGSTDGTPEVLRAYGERDARIVILTNRSGIGLPAALNLGLAQCRAALVARADADDRYPPERLEHQVRFMEGRPEVGLISCAFHTIDAEGTYLFTTFPPTTDGAIRLRELLVNCFAHPGVVFRRDLVLSLGGYDVAYPTSQDADLWARLRPHTKAAILDEPLLHYRRHGAASMARRDDAAAARSLGVRQRLLTAYLGRPVSLEETEAMQVTFLARRSPPDEDLARGLRGLREIRRVATTREDPADLRHFRQDVAEALLKQAFLNGDRPAQRARLLAEALRWDTGTLAGRLRARLTGAPAPQRKAGRMVLSASAR